ncbi:hypothetical protein HKD37_10G028670 [Glycine soja]
MNQLNHDTVSREEGKDRLSELPECVLLHIMNIMYSTYADLWKSLTILTLLHHEFEKSANFNLKYLNNTEIIQFRIMLSTPNLSYLKITNHSGFSDQPLSSTCNLSCLKETTIHTTTKIAYSVFIGWLQLFTNVKILSLSGILK